MQMAIDVAGFTPSEADQLRQAMGSKRSRKRMEKLKARLYEGMAERGITGDVADEIFMKMAAFANYGFPESHSVSFSYLVYASSWIKFHEPAAFCAALLNAQPMGFWSPHSLVQDAQRHGVMVHPPDLNASLAMATLEPCDASVGQVAVRLGFGSMRGVGAELANEIEAGRPYESIEDLVRRVPRLTQVQLEAMATAGCVQPSASGSIAARRCGRSALPCSRAPIGWRVWSPARWRPTCRAWIRWRPRWPICGPPVSSANGHPTLFLRDQLDRQGVITAVGLHSCRAAAPRCWSPGWSRIVSGR